MILVLAGTKDGRLIAKDLTSRGFLVYATTVTKYGAKLFKDGTEVATGALDEQGLRQLITEKGIQAVVDATHPFAKDISLLAIGVCEVMGVKYLRYEREKSIEGSFSNVILAKDYGAVAEKLKEFSRIFLTIGSRNLDKFAHLMGMGKQITARVLPDSHVIKRCEGLGFTPDKLIAMQGPFSTPMNYIMFKECGADIVVTKDSGTVGGVREKIEAAQMLQIPVLLIERPRIDYPTVTRDISDILHWINLK